MRAGSISGASGNWWQPFARLGVGSGGKAERRPVDDASGSRFARGRGRGPGAHDALADIAAGLVRRAQIVQHAVEGLSPPEIAARLDGCKASVRFWLKRFNARGLPGLKEEMRSGRPPTYTPEERRAVITAALSRPPDLA